MSIELPFEILAEGHFTREQLCIRWHEVVRETLPEIEEHIAEQWELRTAEAKRREQLLFNGAMARYLRHRVADAVLEIDAGPTDYRDFVGTNLFGSGFVEEWGWERFANPIGTTGTILSREGRIVLGRRSMRVAFHGGYLHTIGGALEASEVGPGGTIDGFASVRRELREELGLQEADIEAMECVGLIRDFDIWQPELLMEVRVRLSAEELAARAVGADAEREHVGLESCADEPGRIVDFIHAAAPIAPVAVGALMLHGKLKWGEEWYEGAKRDLGGG